MTKLWLALSLLFGVCYPIVDSTYFYQSTGVACPSTAARYCASSLFNNEYAKFDMEFFEGDTP